MITHRDVIAAALSGTDNEPFIDDVFARGMVQDMAERGDIPDEMRGDLDLILKTPHPTPGGFIASLRSLSSSSNLGMAEGTPALDALRSSTQREAAPDDLHFKRLTGIDPMALRGRKLVQSAERTRPMPGLGEQMLAREAKEREELGPSIVDSMLRGLDTDIGFVQATAGMGLKGVNKLMDSEALDAASNALLGMAKANFEKADTYAAPQGAYQFVKDMVFQQIPTMALTLGAGWVAKAGAKMAIGVPVRTAAMNELRATVAKDLTEKLAKEGMTEGVEKVAAAQAEKLVTPELVDTMIDTVARRELPFKAGVEAATEQLAKGGYASGKAAEAMAKAAARPLASKASRNIVESTAQDLGMFGASLALNAGQAYQYLEQERAKNPDMGDITPSDVFIHGVGMAALDTLPLMYFARKFGLMKTGDQAGKMAKEMEYIGGKDKIKYALIEGGKEALKAGAAEGVTEALQEGLAQHARITFINKWHELNGEQQEEVLPFLFNEKQYKNYALNAAGGFVVGGMFGGAGGAWSAKRKKEWVDNELQVRALADAQKVVEQEKAKQAEAAAVAEEEGKKAVVEGGKAIVEKGASTARKLLTGEVDPWPGYRQRLIDLGWTPAWLDKHKEAVMRGQKAPETAAAAQDKTGKSIDAEILGMTAEDAVKALEAHPRFQNLPDAEKERVRTSLFQTISAQIARKAMKAPERLLPGQVVTPAKMSLQARALYNEMAQKWMRAQKPTEEGPSGTPVAPEPGPKTQGPEVKPLTPYEEEMAARAKEEDAARGLDLPPTKELPVAERAVSGPELTAAKKRVKEVFEPVSEKFIQDFGKQLPDKGGEAYVRAVVQHLAENEPSTLANLGKLYKSRITAAQIVRELDKPRFSLPWVSEAAMKSIREKQSRRAQAEMTRDEKVVSDYMAAISGLMADAPPKTVKGKFFFNEKGSSVEEAAEHLNNLDGAHYGEEYDPTAPSEATLDGYIAKAESASKAWDDVATTFKDRNKADIENTLIRGGKEEPVSASAKPEEMPTPEQEAELERLRAEEEAATPKAEPPLAEDFFKATELPPEPPEKLVFPNAPITPEGGGAGKGMGFLEQMQSQGNINDLINKAAKGEEPAFTTRGEVLAHVQDFIDKQKNHTDAFNAAWYSAKTPASGTTLAQMAKILRPYNIHVKSATAFMKGVGGAFLRGTDSKMPGRILVPEANQDNAVVVAHEVYHALVQMVAGRMPGSTETIKAILTPEEHARLMESVTKQRPDVATDERRAEEVLADAFANAVFKNPAGLERILGPNTPKGALVKFIEGVKKYVDSVVLRIRSLLPGLHEAGVISKEQQGKLEQVASEMAKMAREHLDAVKRGEALAEVKAEEGAATPVETVDPTLIEKYGKDFEKEGLHDANETMEEFVQRKHCMDMGETSSVVRYGA